MFAGITGDVVFMIAAYSLTPIIRGTVSPSNDHWYPSIDIGAIFANISRKYTSIQNCGGANIRQMLPLRLINILCK